MRAVVYERYGSPEVLELRDVSMPTPQAGEVLVEVVAASVNLSDWERLRGDPAYARMGGGLMRPATRRRILGSDVAGRVVAAGDGATRFAVGDAVFGDLMPRDGGFAEYVAAPQDMFAAKPAALSFAEASALPQAAAIAAHAVALANPGERMLLNGAGGGSGGLAVQLAVATGVQVTAVDAAGKLDFLRGLGAVDVIDYRRDDFTRRGPFDLIVDLVARRSIFAYRRALARGGRCVIVGGTTRALLRMATVGPLLGAVTGARLGVLAVHQGPRTFLPVAEQVARGEVSVPIDGIHPLEALPEAIARHGEGRALGKVVIAVRDDALLR
ncbi:NAD(P)-dependent alcohol dehydrogenase [Microbacterium awajiense]|uniref:NAD(P)-dependent alcohol dehydrogenase n=1 Tax=Microbacterium awajiense TaxID=415214 RepID=A0ABP6ZZE6_9MICO